MDGRPRTGQPDAKSHRAGVWIFYMIFVAMLAGEGLAVDLILHAARGLGIPGIGAWIAWGLFVLGGAGLGEVELRTIRPRAVLRDPVLRLCCWLQRRFGLAGFVVNAGIIGGAPGAAVALTHVDQRQRRVLTWLAAFIFASVWVPLFVTVWR
jgi:hypothetical protein